MSRIAVGRKPPNPTICSEPFNTFRLDSKGRAFGRLWGLGGRIETPPRVFATFVSTKVEKGFKKK